MITRQQHPPVCLQLPWVFFLQLMQTRVRPSDLAEGEGLSQIKQHRFVKIRGSIQSGKICKAAKSFLNKHSDEGNLLLPCGGWTVLILSCWERRRGNHQVFLFISVIHLFWHSLRFGTDIRNKGGARFAKLSQCQIVALRCLTATPQVSLLHTYCQI